MISNQLSVILGTLALLGTALLFAVAILVAAGAAIRGRTRVAKLAGGGAVGLLGIYTIAWLGAGLLSRDRVKPAGGEKYFCEIDCHLAYSVLGIKPAEQVPGATGRVWAVELRTRFDETTISPRRGREAPLWPSPRHVALRDAEGQAHEPMPGADAWLQSQGIKSTPLSQSLRPGDAYTTTLLFDLPATAVPVHLNVEDAEWINALVIGSEESPWHGRLLLALPPISQ